MKRIASTLLCLALLTPTCLADIAPGHYLTERGWGHLDISPKGKGFAFKIDTVGANGHSCSLDGDIVGGRATLHDGPPNEPDCVVTFSANGKDIDVKAANGEACRAYCGMRAQFEGVYRVPAPGCDDKSRKQARREFKQLYDHKSYVQAAALLDPMLAHCQATLDPAESDWLRNDLALTRYKLGDPAGCRTLLAPLKEEAALTDEAIREGYPPVDAETRLSIARATRTNLKLCGG